MAYLRPNILQNTKDGYDYNDLNERQISDLEVNNIQYPVDWPFKPEEWHGENDDRVTQLKKAGALLAAEITRISPTVDFVKASEAFDFKEAPEGLPSEHRKDFIREREEMTKAPAPETIAVADSQAKTPRKLPIVAHDFITYLWYYFEADYLQYYGSREEFVAHFNSGEVKVPFADIERLHRDFIKQKPEVANPPQIIQP